MRFIVVLILHCFLLGSSSGCNEIADSNPTAKMAPNEEEEQPDPNFDKRAFISCKVDDQLTEKDQDTLRKIKQVFTETPQPCPSVSNKSGNCSNKIVKFTPKEGHPWSLGQRILILDYNMYLVGYTRYHQRVLDYLEVSPSGHYQTIEKSIGMNLGVYKIVGEIVGRDNPYMPARKLNSISSSFVGAYYDPVGMRNDGHGGVVFGLLAEHNPKSEMVIAELEYLSESHIFEHLCSGSEEGAEKIKNYYQNLAKSLIESIKKHEINFINMSAGTTFETMNRVFQGDPAPEQGCVQKMAKKNLPVVSQGALNAWLNRLQQIQLDYFMRPLTNIPGVVFVQAATIAFRDLQAGDPDYLQDCTKLPNRLRIGSLGEFYPGIKKSGTNRWSLLDAISKFAKNCTDLYINSPSKGFQIIDEDWQAAPYVIQFTGSGKGLSEGPLTALSTSFAAPIALSYLIYLKNRVLPANTSVPELLSYANNHGNGKIKDPAFHAEFEKCHIHLDKPANRQDL